MTDAEIDAAVQASRDLMTQNERCGCWVRTRYDLNGEVGKDGKLIWHSCSYHEGYEDGLRAATP